MIARDRAQLQSGCSIDDPRGIGAACRVNARIALAVAALVNRRRSAPRVAAYAVTLASLLPIGRAQADTWSYGTFVLSSGTLQLAQLAVTATPSFGPLPLTVAMQRRQMLGRDPAVAAPALWSDTRCEANARETLRSNTIDWSLALARRGLVGTLKIRF
jgi:hypothetical protein